MKHPVLVLLGLLAAAAAPVSHAVEILRWERMPLAVPLKVGQERIVFIDRNVRVGVPAGVGERLRVQSAGGAVYLRASEPIEPTRLQLQDADTGALILLDIAAEPPKDGEAELAWVYLITCVFDFILFPIAWSILQAYFSGTVDSAWTPITLHGAGLYHMAMGAAIGISAYSRGKEKLNDKI